jgi:sulfur carrier protein
LRITIHNPVHKELALDGKRRVSKLLEELQLNPETHLVIRDGELLTRDDILRDEDNVEILSAISGG